MKKKVYIALSADFIHHGHMNLIEKAKDYGDLIVGLLTDNAISNYKDIPYLNFQQRKRVLNNLKFVKKIIPQNEWDYSCNIKKIKPDFFVHGDDWNFNGDIHLKYSALKALKSYGGKLIEIKHTPNVFSSTLIKKNLKLRTTAEIRRSTLIRLLKAKNFLRFIEVHSAISGIIVERTKIRSKNDVKFFDGFWSSSLTDSVNFGKPDNESVTISQRLDNINSVFDVTTKPLIMDFDSGGKKEHFQINLKSAERLGISAIIIEDKKGLKKNSLFKKNNQPQESINEFCEKIKIGKNSKLSKDFLIIARIESLVLDKKMNDALKRASSYIKAGIDGIMIHSKLKDPKEIFEFAKKFKRIKNSKNIPLICIPSTYNMTYEKELRKAGFNIVIYANHLMRSIIPAMEDTVKKILKYERSFELDKKLLSINSIISLID
jgi:phosphoenolpyruvate phosphomutase